MGTKKNQVGIYLVLLLMFFTSSYVAALLHQGLHNIYYPSGLIDFDIFLFFVSLLSFLVLLQFTKFYFWILLSAIVFYGAAAAMAIGSVSGIDVHIACFTPFFISSLCILFEHTTAAAERPIGRFYQYVFFIWLFCMAVLGVYLHHKYAYRSYPVKDNNTLIQNGVLGGIYASASKIDVLDSIIHQYYANDCQHKYFLAYPALPLLYYLFSREDRYGGWISYGSGRLHESKVAINTLKKQEGWCVIEAPEFNDNPKNYLLSLRQFLQQHSLKTIMYTHKIKPVTLELYPVSYVFYVK